MSKRVTNLIESILGSASAAGTVADAAEATHAPKYDTTTPTTRSAEPSSPSMLESTAGKDKLRQQRQKEMVAAALAKSAAQAQAQAKAKAPKK